MKFIIIFLFSFFTSFGLLAQESPFNEVLKNYEELNKAFFNNDNINVKKNSEIILKSIENIQNEKIKKALNFSITKLNEMSKSDDIKQNQESFNIVSQAFLYVIKSYSPNKNYVPYYCPMVKKYWIQNISKSDVVMNPYASKTMPHCGEMKK
ncbi:MAG: DUF3347 domain-containing protein [Halobacteriovoraceae bacterium]|nr:DUF3347 domain-containing protein [Halobacteriovoraceae bacterium]